MSEHIGDYKLGKSTKGKGINFNLSHLYDASISQRVSCILNIQYASVDHNDHGLLSHHGLIHVHVAVMHVIT